MNTDGIATTSSVPKRYKFSNQVLDVNEPAIRPISWVGKTRPCEITEVPIDTVRAPTAIPIIANFMGVKSLFDTKAASITDTNTEETTHPKNTPKPSTVNTPAVTAAKNIAAPPPIPNKLGSPRGLRVDNCKNIPAKPRQAPASILKNTLGALRSQIMV